MKKYILSLAFMFIVGLAYAVETDHYIVDVDTNGVVAIGEEDGRRQLKIKNEGPETAYIATEAIDKDTYESVGAYAIEENGEYVDDTYMVYKSTWYVTTSTNTTRITVEEKW